MLACRGEIAEKRDSYDEAKARFVEACNIYAKIPDAKALGDGYYNLAWMAYRRKQLDDATVFAKKAVDAHEIAKTKDRLAVAWDWVCLGISQPAKENLPMPNVTICKSVKSAGLRKDSPIYRSAKIASHRPRVAGHRLRRWTKRESSN